MNDYTELNLITTPSPHLHGPVTTRAIMLDVIVAMLPALAYATFWFGFRALALTGIAVVACLVWEALYCLALRRHQTVGDLSAAVTGVLLAFVCPVDVRWWQLVIGAFVAIVVVKQLFGGIGKNLLNPALTGGLLVRFCFGARMDGRDILAEIDMLAGQPEAVAAAPMSYLKGTDMAAAFHALTEKYSLAEMFLGKVGGAMGEVCVLALLAGGIYLLGRRIISWHIPVGCIAAVAVLALIFPCGDDALQWMLYSLCGGGLLLGAFFMAADYTTSPVSDGGRLIYGIGCGVLAVLLRHFLTPELGVYCAVLVMNCTTPLLDRVIRPIRFGASD